MRTWYSKDIYKPIGSYNRLVYSGPSQLTGDPILVIATAQNGNRKIGHMLQFWIVPAISPITAVQTGADAAVCGDCKLRGDHGHGRACYVEYWRAVENIWQARAKARPLTPEAFAARYPGLQLRLGAYGDPVAVPLSVWTPLLETAAGWTAYTHQWRRSDPRYQAWCMASVDSLEEQREATAAGWRTFRVRVTAWDHTLSSEIVCPASDEGGHRTVCAKCELCRGTSLAAKSVVIAAHGTNKIYFHRTPPPLPAPRLVRPEARA